MKKILSTLVAVGVLAGAAHAQTFNPFNDPRQALPRSETSNDDYRQALPRAPQVSDDEYKDALPFVDTVFPDVTIATP
jgi:hypothetical protein